MELAGMDTKPRCISGAANDMHGIIFLICNWLIATIAPQCPGFSYKETADSLAKKFKKYLKKHPYTLSTDLSSMDATVSYELKEVTEHILLRRFESQFRLRLIQLGYL